MLNSRSDKPVDNLPDTVFEDILRRISINAFDALINCGVRDINGFLSITEDKLRKVGVASHIIAELLHIQRQVDDQLILTSSGVMIGWDVPKNILEERQKIEDLKDSATKIIGTLIPDDLLNNLATHSRRILSRKKIVTCEHLLQFQSFDFFKMHGVGTTTVHDFKRLQSNIIQRYPALSNLKKKHTTTNKKGTILPFFYPHGIDFSQLGKRKPSDPSEWSLLRHSLYELMQIPDLILNEIADQSFNTLNINSYIDIATENIERLRMIAIFPDDFIDVLYFLSLDYLLEAKISEELFAIIIKSIHDKFELLSSFNFIDRICDISIFNDLDMDSISEFKVTGLHDDIILLFGNMQHEIRWSNIALLSEQFIIKRLGLTMHGLNCIQQVWKLREQATKFSNKFAKGLSIEDYCSFDQLVNAFVYPVAKNERESTILKGRLGVLEGRKWTLEELGNNEKITRERVRQIEGKRMPFLTSDDNLQCLNRLWLAVAEILSAAGGICSADEVAHALAQRWRWQSCPTDEAMAAFINLSESFEIVWASPIRIIMPGYSCISCTEIGPVLAKAVCDQENGILSFGEAICTMQSYCQQRGCGITCGMLLFSKGFLYYLDDVIEEIFADDQALYNQYAWALKYGKHRVIVVEMILRNSGRPMHFTEVHAEVNKDRPTHGQISERNIYAYIERSPDLLLWDRGTYIHRIHVTIPIMLITEIENDILCRINNDIPYISISGIFDLFKAKLVAAAIPSESALYSCLRESNNLLLDYPYYPYVTKRGISVQRKPIPLMVESFVLEQNKTVTWEQIRDFAVKRLCLNEIVFMANYFSNIPNLLRVNKGKYVHLQQLELEEEKLIPIIDHLNSLLRIYPHVSVAKLFNDKRVTCRMIGVTTSMLLFSLLQIFFADQFDLSKYPLIRQKHSESLKDRVCGFAAEVITYILSKKGPCRFTELYEHYVDGLGYENRSVYNVQYDKNILHYSEGMIVHLASLGWSAERQIELESIAASHLNDRAIAGKAFGLASHLYEYMFEHLPQLPEQILWTPTLIVELLSQGGNYRIIGTQRNAFVSIPNVYRIETLDDLLYFILEKEYDGAAKLDIFSTNMRDIGILKKKLTPIMLGIESKVMIDGDIIRLTELHDSAT